MPVTLLEDGPVTRLLVARERLLVARGSDSVLILHRGQVEEDGAIQSALELGHEPRKHIPFERKLHPENAQECADGDWPKREQEPAQDEQAKLDEAPCCELYQIVH